jgi:ABC-type polysaccharide/polyol phosphate export permease
MTASSFVQNRSVLMAFKLDPWIFILSQTLDNLMTLIASFGVLLLMAGDLNVFSGMRIPLLVLSLLLVTLATYFLSFLVATLHVFMRDTQFIVQFLVNVIYFATPIFYPIDLIPEKYQWVIAYNPFFILIKPFQSIFWKHDLSLFGKDTLSSLVLIFLITALCLFYWRRKKNDIYFNI